MSTSNSSRFGWTDEDRTTPIELGSAGWSATWRRRSRVHRPRRDPARAGRQDVALAAERAGRRLADYDRIYDEAGLIPPKDHTPIQDEYYVYDDDLNQLGYATSQMYSPMLQRHIALARVPLDRSAPGSRVKLEMAVNHRYHYFDAVVARTPLFNPERRTA